MKIYYLIVLIVMSISLVNAAPTLFFGDNQAIDIKVPCDESGNPCQASTKCNITINYPNNSNLIMNKAMTNNLVYFNYSIPSQNVGEYSTYVFCTNGTNADSSFFQFKINSSSVNNGNMGGLIAILTIILAFMFGMTAAFYFRGNMALCKMFFETSFVVLTIITYLGYQLSKDFGLAISNVILSTYYLSLSLTVFFFIIILLDWSITLVMGGIANQKIKDNLL